MNKVSAKTLRANESLSCSEKPGIGGGSFVEEEGGRGYSGGGVERGGGALLE